VFKGGHFLEIQCTKGQNLGQRTLGLKVTVEID